jgi:hypothetical protein
MKGFYNADAGRAGGPKSAAQRVYVAMPTIHQGKKIVWRRLAPPTRELKVPS